MAEVQTNKSNDLYDLEVQRSELKKQLHELYNSIWEKKREKESLEYKLSVNKSHLSEYVNPVVDKLIAEETPLWTVWRSDDSDDCLDSVYESKEEAQTNAHSTGTYSKNYYRYIVPQNSKDSPHITYSASNCIGVGGTMLAKDIPPRLITEMVQRKLGIFDDLWEFPAVIYF